MAMVYVYDLTLSRHLDETKESTPTQLIAELQQMGKKWVFQGELSAPTEKNPEGFKHWQIRVSLWKKMRAPQLWALKTRMPLLHHAHVTITSNEVAQSFTNDAEAFYITKADTRIEDEGPFSDRTDKPVFIQKEVQQMIDGELRPWQKQIVDSRDVYDARTINVVVDEEGNSGKSAITAYLRAKGLAVCAPAMDAAADYMALVLAKDKLGMYIFDLPRAIPKKNMNQLFAAIEQIKDGYAFDRRYKFRDETFERPVIWVFSNTPPPMECLSADRWCFWEVDRTVMKLRKRILVQATPIRAGGSAAGFLSGESMLVAERPAKRIRMQ